jgi:Holliday junction DNA helicase RuvB
LTDEVEPFLLRSELVVRTPRGRMVTTKGYQHLRLDPPASSQRSPHRDAQSRLFPD